jgi:dihydroorotase
MKNFVSAIEDLKEKANDLGPDFFFLPKNDEFVKITKELSQI